MRKALYILWITVAFICSGPQVIQVDSAIPREHLIKAAFLYNFAKFVQWPPAAFGDPEDPIKIGVFGDDTFEDALGTLQNKTVAGRKIVVDSLDDVENLNSYHMLFLSRSKSERIDQIMPDLKGRPILTISDADNFTHKGGIIYLFKQDNKIRFNVNIVAAERNQLKISSKLLKLAQVVERKLTNSISNENDR